jgi:hypothetical protein
MSKPSASAVTSKHLGEGEREGDGGIGKVTVADS